MTLIADRFVEHPHSTIDLATGHPVTLLVSTAGGRSEQQRWAERCDWFSRLRHRSFPILVDFGASGEGQRFEAWHCCDAGTHAADREDVAERAVDIVESASRFLVAAGRSIGSLTTADTRVVGSRVVVIPGAECGYETAVLATPSSLPRAPLAVRDYGLWLVSRRPVTVVSELLAEPSGARPRAVALWGPIGSGVRTAANEIARAARRQGFVPLRLPSMETSAREVSRLLRGRSLCLFVVDHPPSNGWRLLLERLLDTSKPHVIVFAGRQEVRSVDGMSLDPIPPDVLVSSLQPTCSCTVVRSRATRAAERCHGLPGTFVHQLFKYDDASDGAPVELLGESVVRPRRTWTNRVAEQPAAYGAETLPSDNLVRPPPDPQPMNFEVRGLHERMATAVALIQRGRHEPGTRALRQIIGSLARRDDLNGAARGGLALARALLRRGRANDAQAALDEARRVLTDDVEADPAFWVDVAVLTGLARTDLGRLDEAESILHGAVVAARAFADPVRSVHARLALARCLFWRGRFTEAAHALSPVEQPLDERISESLAVDVAIMASRVAVGSGDVARGVALSSAALEVAQRLGDPCLIARTAHAAAFAHRAVGDSSATDRDLALCLEVSRRTRDPLCAVRGRVLAAEFRFATASPRHSRALLQRLSRLSAGRLPITLRIRCRVLLDLCQVSAVTLSASVVAGVVKRHADATGLQALSLFAPSGIPAPHLQALDRPDLKDVLDILYCCQSADEGRAVILAVLAILKSRLNAVAVACFAASGQLVASQGGRVESRVAERVVAAGQTITPHATDGSIEGGALVRYGGKLVAAVACRWTMGTTHDASHAAALLTMAAAAIGPAVAEVLASNRESAARVVGDIVGTTAAVAAVRHAVEQAAAAPFPVLVEGESGSGKELVARAIHRHGPRRDRPFCSINCAALPDDLVESELFGHARGAFTGAVGERIGVFEEAHTGTLLLDEIGELSARAQAKVLRTIQEGELRRVGENVARRVDVRIVAATNRDLRKETAAGRFRLDLLYRLDVIRVVVPPLRDRREDIAVLAERFWRDATSRLGSRAILAPATTAALAEYDWPGNVRELQNVLASLAVRSPKRGSVPPSALPPQFQTTTRCESLRLDAARRTFEERFVRAALIRSGGHRLRAAGELGITRQGLCKLMSRLGIQDGSP